MFLAYHENSTLSEKINFFSNKAIMLVSSNDVAFMNRAKIVKKEFDEIREGGAGLQNTR